MSYWRILSALFIACWVAGCKLIITVPPGGHVESQSGTWICRTDEPCTIDVSDSSFKETFVGVPDEGFRFVGWRNDQFYFCGQRDTPCTLSTEGFDSNPKLVEFLEGDQEFFLQPIFVSEAAAAQHTITPAGGTFEFLNGLVLDIPAGAVDESVTVTVTDLPGDEVDPILSFHTGAVSEKRYLGGFSVTPDIEFNVPITATFPVAALEPYEYPMQIEVERGDGKYWFQPTVLEYRPESQDVQIEVSHFSDIGTAAMAGLDGETLDILCTDPDLNANEICEALDELQPAACLLKREERPPGTDCCREGLISVRSEAIDFSSNRGTEFCEMLSDLVEVSYHECELPDGSVPTEVSELCEMSVNCPQDEFLGADVTIVPPQTSCFLKGDQLTLQANVVDGDGNNLPANAVQWRSAEGSVATVGPNGVLTARGAGDAMVEARYRYLCKDFSDTTQISIGDLSGIWLATEIADERDCDEGVNTYQAVVNITQTGNQVSVSGPPGLNINGSRTSPCGMSLSGSEFEDDGRSFGNGTATIAATGNRIDGSGGWTWRGTDPDTGEQISCSGSSEFTLTR